MFLYNIFNRAFDSSALMFHHGALVPTTMMLHLPSWCRSRRGADKEREKALRWSWSHPRLVIPAVAVLPGATVASQPTRTVWFRTDFQRGSILPVKGRLKKYETGCTQYCSISGSDPLRQLSSLIWHCRPNISSTSFQECNFSNIGCGIFGIICILPTDLQPVIL